jgi:hypothetical protein
MLKLGDTQSLYAVSIIIGGYSHSAACPAHDELQTVPHTVHTKAHTAGQRAWGEEKEVSRKVT